jgi:hypothetical protein
LVRCFGTAATAGPLASCGRAIFGIEVAEKNFSFVDSLVYVVFPSLSAKHLQDLGFRLAYVDLVVLPPRSRRCCWRNSCSGC